MSLILRFLEAIGAPLLEEAKTLLLIPSLFLDTILQGFSLKNWCFKEFFSHIAQLGFGSLSMIMLTTSFAGMIVTHEMAWHMDEALHTVTMIPGLSAQFILREMGIAIPALLMVAKVGAGITAEIATMKVTEQIDALKLLGINPIGYLVFPRWLAVMISSVCLTMLAIGVTLTTALLTAVTLYPFTILEYLNSVSHFIGLKDLACAMIKGFAYGNIMPIISCAYGFRAQGGAQGVGNATTRSVVTSTMVIIFFDFVLTLILGIGFRRKKNNGRYFK